MDMVEIVRSASKDPSTQVGAVIVSATNRVKATGYNGFPFGADDSPELYEDREYKYSHIIHAELNAIFQAATEGVSITPSDRMYCSLLPCIECANAIAQVGIREVVVPSVVELQKYNPKLYDRWKDSFAKSIARFNELNIVVRFVPRSTVMLAPAQI